MSSAIKTIGTKILKCIKILFQLPRSATGSGCSGARRQDSGSRSWAAATSSSGSATRSERPSPTLTSWTTCLPRRWAPTRATVPRRPAGRPPSTPRPPRPPPVQTAAANTTHTRVPRRPPRRPPTQLPATGGRPRLRRCCPPTAAVNDAAVTPACHWAIRAATRTDEAVRKHRPSGCDRRSHNIVKYSYFLARQFFFRSLLRAWSLYFYFILFFDIIYYNIEIYT